MKKRITPPAKGKTIKASFLNDIAAAASKVGATRQQSVTLFKTVRVSQDFVLHTSGDYSEGECIELLFTADENDDISATPVSSEEAVTVVDPSKTLHRTGDILQTYFNPQFGRWQTFNAKEYLPEAELQRFALNCGCNDFLPEEKLIVEWGSFGPYAGVYYYTGIVPGPQGLYQRIRLEHVTDNIWQSPEFEMYEHVDDTVDPATTTPIIGYVEMEVIEVNVYYDIVQPMAIISFVPTTAMDGYVYDYNLPDIMKYRTLRPFHPAMNGNILSFMSQGDERETGFMVGCQSCLSASRDLLPCEECNSYTRVFMRITEAADVENCYERLIPLAGDYVLYSELNSYFEGVAGWPVTNALCAFESEQLLEIEGDLYKLVLLRTESTYEYEYSGPITRQWKIGLVGIDDENNLVEVGWHTLTETDCALVQEEVQIALPDILYEESCTLTGIIDYLDAGAV